MIAIVQHVDTDDGFTKAIVRRGYRVEIVDGQHDDIRRGDRINVKRITNNPYLVRMDPSDPNWDDTGV